MAEGDMLEPERTMMMRLDRFLSEAGVGTRKELREMIRSGRVTLNGEIVKRPEQKMDEAGAIVLVDGVAVRRPGTVVLMLHKPAGYVTSTDEPGSRTVMELLPPEYQKLFPVGRLDKDTEGLLLFTNDGELCHTLTSPKHRVEKEYYAETDGEIDEADIAAFRAGIRLKDGTQCLPALLRPGKQGCFVVVREGKYHQVRRMLASRGKPVKYLRREREGDLVLGQLSPGEYRLLFPEEISQLGKLPQKKMDF